MPTAKDAERTLRFFADSGIFCTTCETLSELCGEIENGAGAALLTEEAILQDGAGCLVEAQRRQPSWSKFPLIVLSQPRQRNKDLDDAKFNMVLVERPVRVETLRSVVRAALRHRRHQYDIRDMLLDLARQAEGLGHLAAIVEWSNDAIISKDLNGIITSWNQGAERLFGYPASEAIGQPISILIPPERLDEEPGILEKIRSGKSIENYETVRMHKTGTLLNISLTVSPIRNPRGEIVGASKIARDITGRKRSEEALRESAAVLKTVTSEARVGLVMVNRERRYVFANQTYAEILSLPDVNIVGRHVSEVLPAVYDQIGPRLDRAFGGERVSYELRVPQPGETGNERFYEVVYEPRTQEVTEPYVVVVIVDITERKKAQQILEETVNERTAKLREMVGELEAFSYSISHDMRSPLRAMQGYADVLLAEYKDKVGETGAHYLERISRSAARLDLLIQDVLAYSKVTKGEIELHEIDLEGLLDSVIENYSELQPAAASISIVRPLPRVIGHEAYLTQIVSNLLGNAVKFVAPGVVPEVRIRAETEGEMARFWFEDNGVGIEPRHHAEIFRIFGRVYAEKKYKGTGIGLAIVKKAAERMGGAVGVESELGKGSRFWLTLKKAL
jgi:PAS domain S-box-containing protein